MKTITVGDTFFYNLLKNFSDRLQVPIHLEVRDYRVPRWRIHCLEENAIHLNKLVNLRAPAFIMRDDWIIIVDTPETMSNTHQCNI